MRTWQQFSCDLHFSKSQSLETKRRRLISHKTSWHWFLVFNSGNVLSFYGVFHNQNLVVKNLNGFNWVFLTFQCCHGHIIPLNGSNFEIDLSPAAFIKLHWILSKTLNKQSNSVRCCNWFNILRCKLILPIKYFQLKSVLVILTGPIGKIKVWKVITFDRSLPNLMVSHKSVYGVNVLKGITTVGLKVVIHHNKVVKSMVKSTNLPK